MIDKNSLNRRVIGIFQRYIKIILDNIGLINKYLKTLNITMVEIFKNRIPQILYNFLDLINSNIVN